MQQHQQGSVPGFGQPRQQANNGQMDPVNYIRQSLDNMLSAGPGAATGINWERYGDSRLEDPAFRDMRESVYGEQDIERMLLEKYTYTGAQYLQMMLGRRSRFYDEYRSLVENFRLNRRTGLLCPIRDEFVKTLIAHPEMYRTVAAASLPLFIDACIRKAKTKSNYELDQAELMDASIYANRCVLGLEMVSWLMRHPRGRELVYSLSPEIKEMVSHLEDFKEVYARACGLIGNTNPYGSLVWEIKVPGRTDSHLIMDAEMAHLRGSYEFAHDSSASNLAQDSDLRNMLRRQAARYDNGGELGNRWDIQKEPEIAGDAWNSYRTDLKNLTPQNAESYRLRRYFKYIGRPNHYFIPESDWKAIKHVFPAHAEQPSREESIMPGTFRVVIIDMDNIGSGWFSTVVRAEELDMPTVISNPEKLLPFLEQDRETGEVYVSTITAKEALKGRKKGSKDVTIPVEVCEELVGIPSVAVTERIVTNTSNKLVGSLITTNKQMTSKLTHENAVSFNAVLWDTFNLSNPEDKATLRNVLPFLFQDVEDEEADSFAGKIAQIADVIGERYLDDELAQYLDYRFTSMFNDWLISAAGYDRDPHSENALSVDSILTDYKGIAAVLKSDDHEAYQRFTQPADADNYLTNALKLFVYESQYSGLTTNGDEGNVFIAQADQELVLERNMNVIMVNKRKGPYAEVHGEPVMIKRSKFPEYFELVEKSFEATMGDASIRTVPKLMFFDKGEHFWLFEYSIFDRNTATLRWVDPERHMIELRPH